MLKNERSKRVRKLPKVIQLENGRTRTWKETCLIGKLLVFSIPMAPMILWFFHTQEVADTEDLMQPSPRRQTSSHRERRQLLSPPRARDNHGLDHKSPESPDWCISSQTQGPMEHSLPGIFITSEGRGSQKSWQLQVTPTYIQASEPKLPLI